MSHRKFEHGSLGFLPRKRAAHHKGKCILGFFSYIIIILLKMMDDLMKLKRALAKVIFREFGEHTEY
ncbi:60S ribosomal protein L3-2 [Camellia lanceoleosa]|uniref:60S ribosomal protein L3-2 n=1 Tax=Camellia lanceoleosa TaxID=1840588 RepID=A0ACC0G446_9ERIC|nr:60S ribosomal protein L3-2 [Camellia lanceoleosa]